MLLNRLLARQILCSLAALLLSSSLVAAQPPNGLLQPFAASYSIDWNGGLAISGDTLRQLERKADNTWQFQSSATSLFASITEITTVEWQTEQLRPLEYSYLRSVLGKKRHVTVSFDWQQGQAINTVKDKPWKMDVEPGVQDKLSYQLMLQLLLARGETEFDFTVADGGHLKNYRFSVQGEETVAAPIGEYRAIQVARIHDNDSDRKTLIWFAPELNYQIIKLHHVEEKGKAYTLLLKKLDTPATD